MHLKIQFRLRSENNDKKIIFFYTKPFPRPPGTKISFYYRPIAEFEYPEENYKFKNNEEVFVIDCCVNKIYDGVVKNIGNKDYDEPQQAYFIEFPYFSDKNDFYSREYLLTKTDKNNEIFNGESNQMKENINDFIIPNIMNTSIEELESRMDKKRIRTWSQREDRLLVRLIACFDSNEVDWALIS